MAETINSIDDKIRLKAETRLDQEILAAFPQQTKFSAQIEVDLSRVSTVNGKYTVQQLMNAIRGAVRRESGSQFYQKDVESFLMKVEKLPAEDKP